MTVALRSTTRQLLFGGGVVMAAFTAKAQQPLDSTSTTTTTTTIVISEISDKGTSTVCNGDDWIELYNPGNRSIDLGAERYMLHDDKGYRANDAFFFPTDSIIDGNGYMLLCSKQKLIGAEEDEQDNTNGNNNNNNQALPPDPMSPQFGISGDDTITLVQVLTNNNNEGSVVEGDTTVTINKNSPEMESYAIISSVTLPDTFDAFDITYARDPTTGVYNYTSTPTPEAANVMTHVLSLEERIAQHKKELAAQDAMGRKFFNMDERGFPVDDAMDTVLELKLTMDAADYDYLMLNQTFELYRPFQSGKLLKKDGTEVLSLDSPGRVRPKGQSGLFVGTCLDTPDIPFQLEFDRTNSSQTLFGVQKAYLRHHAEDYSFAREWTYLRMLARFGLPHLRARKVNFYINDNFHGFYTLMEAPEHEYVFHRQFPDYDPESFALYKVKSLAKDCGMYSPEEIAQAEARINDLSTPPYSFERGEHKTPVVVHNMVAFQKCRDQFMEQWYQHIHPDIVLAYVRHDHDCSEMLMTEGLVDLDLGTDDYKRNMKQFIQDHLGANQCDPGCANSNLKDEVDQENFLKMFAFYAVTLSLDSVISFGNNYFLAQTGAEKYGGKGGWKMVPYDLNARQVVKCNDDICNARLVHWSIARPTCESFEGNQIVGPLLSDPVLHAQYLEYAREFLDTVYGNETFWGEIQEHIAEIKEDVRADFWSAYGAFYPDEVSPTASEWNSGQFPLLPVIKARTEDLRAQLKAIDDKTLARAPHIGAKGDNEPWETCADWRLEEPDTSACEQGCKYEGCDISGWTVESFCYDGNGTCYHGEADEMCFGVPDYQTYPGMEESDSGQVSFCRRASGIPVKASECPAIGEATASGQFLQSTSAAVTTFIQSSLTAVLAGSLLMATSMFLLE